MSKYLNGHQVIATLNIEAFELVEFAKKGVLQPYTKHGKKICDIEKNKEFKNQDGHRLYVMKLQLGSLRVGPVMTQSGLNLDPVRKIKKDKLEKEIKALEKKGVEPLDEKQCIPVEFKDCIWERFDLPISQNAAEKIINQFRGYLYLRSDAEKLKNQSITEEIDYYNAKLKDYTKEKMEKICDSITYTELKQEFDEIKENPEIHDEDKMLLIDRVFFRDRVQALIDKLGDDQIEERKKLRTLLAATEHGIYSKYEMGYENGIDGFSASKDKIKSDPTPEEFLDTKTTCQLFSATETINLEQGDKESLNTGADYSETIQKIEVGPDNDFQIMIRNPGEPQKPCTYHDLGCRNERTDEFKYLRDVIQEGYISLGAPKDKIKFKRACEKLTNYIKQKYIPSMPDDFKIYEKIEKNTFRLIFKKIKEADFDPTKKLKGMSKEQLLQELQRLVEKKMPDNIIHEEGQKTWKKKQDDKITNIGKCAQEQGATYDEIMNIIESKADIESVTDQETKRDDSFAQCLNEGLRIIKS